LICVPATLRQATLADLPQLVPISAACVKEMLQRDPLQEDPEGFPMRVRQRVKSGRTSVLEESGQRVFKLEEGTRSQFGGRDQQFQPAARHIQQNLVTALHQGQRPAVCCLGCHMQHHGAISRARHARVRDAHHVAHALRQQLLGQRHIAHFGHARIAFGPAVAQNEDRACVNL
jgi:hypothetical protein